LYEQAALWDQAAKNYSLLADRYSKDAHAADALFNAGVLREHLGDTQGATLCYKLYAERYKNREDAREVAFRAGVVLADSGQKAQAAHAFADFAAKYPQSARVLEARMREGAALIDIGDERRAQDALDKAIALWKRMKTDVRELRAAAAHARYLQGEILFHQFERVKLAADPRRLKRTLDEKSALLERAKAIYVDVVSFGDPEWATGALYRIGEAYEGFARALREAPIPQGLSADEQQVYRDELEKVVVTVEDKAIDAYKGGYKKALELKLYNEFTQKLRAALGRMTPEEFPPESEQRARPTTAEPALKLPFYGSVERR
jgi:tetratricopeptide (TPR) repeat protein